jgi:hypothetical protein
VPGFALLFLAVRGLPVWRLNRAELPASERRPLALLSASALPLVVAITPIAVERERLAAEDAVALVGAGMLSLLLFPLVALAVVRRAQADEPGPGRGDGEAQRSVTTDR